MFTCIGWQLKMGQPPTPFDTMPYPHFYNPEKLILLKKKRINESRMD